MKELTFKSFKPVPVVCLKGGINDYDTFKSVSVKQKAVHSKKLMKCSPQCVHNMLCFWTTRYTWRVWNAQTDRTNRFLFEEAVIWRGRSGLRLSNAFSSVLPSCPEKCKGWHRDLLCYVQFLRVFSWPPCLPIYN